jgi:hypothetical protein
MRAHTLLIVLLALPLLAQSPSAAKKLADADAAYEAGRFEDALKRYEEATKLDPKAADERRLVGFSFINPDRAPEGSRLRTDAAELKRVQGRALALVRRHIDAHGPSELIVAAYADLLIQTGRTKEGFDWLDAARAKDSKNVVLIRGSLLLSTLTDDYPRIISALDDLAREAGTAEDLHYGGMGAYQAAKKAADAQRRELLARGVALERAALKKSPKSFESLTYLSILLKEQAALAKSEGEKKRLLSEADSLSKKAQEAMARKQEREILRNWTVEIVQDGMVNATASGYERISTAVIGSRPFTIRVRISAPVGIALNAMTTDDTVNRVVAGFDVSRDCFPEETSLFPCPPTSVAIDPGTTRIFTGPAKTNFLSPDPQDGQWTRRKREGDGWVLERDVTAIDKTPIASWSDQLYVVLLLDPDGAPITNRDIRRFLITFL